MNIDEIKAPAIAEAFTREADRAEKSRALASIVDAARKTVVDDKAARCTAFMSSAYASLDELVAAARKL